MKPRFSVIIAVYNGEKTIRRAIESVLGQTYPAHELIVVDDGSTDKTAEVVKSFAGFTGFAGLTRLTGFTGFASSTGFTGFDGSTSQTSKTDETSKTNKTSQTSKTSKTNKTNLTYLYQPNAGVSAARNAGAKLASGDWLAFLDADDWYYPDRLRWHAEWIERDPGLDFLTGDQEYRRPDGTLIRRSMESTEAGISLLRKANGQREVIMEGAEIGQFVEDHFGDTHTLSVPRKTFLELGGYPPGRKVAEDVHLLIRLCAVSRRVGVICEPLAAYVVRGDSATRSAPLRSQELTVETLAPLGDLLSGAPAVMRRGYRGRMRRAKLDLAYSLLRNGRRYEAIRAVLPLLATDFCSMTMRDLLSVIRGVKEDNHD